MQFPDISTVQTILLFFKNFLAVLKDYLLN